MKQLLVVIAFLCAVRPSAAVIVGQQNDGLDYLRNEISRLEKELAQKTEKLNKCAKKNKNFQVAGIATVGLAAAGVTTNISLYSKMKDQKELAQQLNNRIKTANVKTEQFFADFEKQYQNVDYDKFLQKMDSTLTDAEKQRFVELAENDFNNLDENNISESDKVILEKMVIAVRDSQKQ